MKSRKYFKFDFVKLSFLLALVLIIFSWAYIYIEDNASFLELFSEKNAFYAKKFLRRMLGIDEENPAFFSYEMWKGSLKLTLQTLQMSVMAIGFSTVGMLMTVIPGARNAAEGRITLSRRWYSWLLFGIIRVLYIFSRAVPELVWAMIIVFIFKPGVLSGALALSLHNFGILGKLCAEVIEDTDLRSIRNLVSSGASSGQILIYGVIPAVMPKFLTYILYRWEVILRTTIVVGLVGAGGLGMQFKLTMSYFKYTEVTLVLLCYMLLVALADIVSEVSRRIAK